MFEDSPVISLAQSNLPRDPQGAMGVAMILRLVGHAWAENLSLAASLRKERPSHMS